MKLSIFFALSMSFTQLSFVKTPYDIVGTENDPNLAKYTELSKDKSARAEFLKAAEVGYADEVRCKNTQRAAIYKMQISALQNLIYIEKERAKLAAETSKVSSANTGVRKVKIKCEDESTKPKTPFELLGTDSNGEVEAEGHRGAMLVKLSYNNRKPDLGRTIEVIVNGQSTKLSLNPGLGPIGFKPGFAMRMLLKAVGLSPDIKVNCFPESQQVIPDVPPVPPSIVIPVITAPTVSHDEDVQVNGTTRASEKEKESVESTQDDKPIDATR